MTNLCAAIEMPTVHGHPNRLAFEGCLTLVDIQRVRFDPCDMVDAAILRPSAHLEDPV
jgi:hypothetical protein